MNSMASQKILVEDLENLDNIPEEEIKEYAKQIGIDVDHEEHLMWIAYEGIQAPVPHPWCPVEDEKGNIYYFNQRTGDSMWVHPCDAYYSSVVIEEREFYLRNKSLNTTCSDPGFESKLSSLADAPPLSSGGSKNLASLSKDTTKALFPGKGSTLGKLDHGLDSHKLAPMKLESLNKSQSSALDRLSSKSSVFPKGSLMKNVKKSLPENASKLKKKELDFTSSSQRIVKFDLDDNNSEEGSHYSYEETDYEGEDFPYMEDMILDKFGILDASQLSPVHSAVGSPEPVDVNSLVKMKMKSNDNSLKVPHPYLKGKGKINLNDDEISTSSNSRKIERKPEESFQKSAKSLESKNSSVGGKVKLGIEPGESPKSHKLQAKDTAGQQRTASFREGLSGDDKLAVAEEHNSILESIAAAWKIKRDELENEEKAKFDRMKEEWVLKLKEEQDTMRLENENKMKELKEKLAAEVEMEHQAMRLSLDNLKRSNADAFTEEKKKLEAELNHLIDALKKEAEEKKQKMEQMFNEEKAALEAEHQKNLAEMKESHSAEVRSLKNNIPAETGASDEAEDLKLELKEIKDIVEDEQQKLLKLQGEISSLEEKKKNIEKEHADLSRVLKEDGQAVKNLQEEKHLIVRDIEELQEEAEKIENDLDMLRGEKTAIFKELTGLKSELNKEKGVISHLKKEKGELENKRSKKLEKSVQAIPVLEDKQCFTEFTYHDESCQVELINDATESFRESSKFSENKGGAAFDDRVHANKIITEVIPNGNVNETQGQEVVVDSYCQNQIVDSGDGKIYLHAAQTGSEEKIESSSVPAEGESAVHHNDMEEFAKMIMSQFDARMNTVENHVKSLEEKLSRNSNNETIPDVKSNKIYTAENSPENIYATASNKVDQVSSIQQSIPAVNVPQVPLPLYAISGDHTAPVYVPSAGAKPCYCDLGDSCEILLGLKHSLHHLQQQVHQQYVPPWTNYPVQKGFNSSSTWDQQSQLEKFRSELKDLRDKHHSTLLKFQLENNVSKENSEVFSHQPGTSRDISQARNSGQPNVGDFSTYYNNWMSSPPPVYSANDDPVIRAREIVRREQERAKIQSQHFIGQSSPLYESYSFHASHSGSHVPSAVSTPQFPMSAQIPPLESSVSAGFGMHFRQIRPEIVSEHEIKTDLEAWLARLQNMHQRIRRHDRL